MPADAEMVRERGGYEALDVLRRIREMHKARARASIFRSFTHSPRMSTLVQSLLPLSTRAEVRTHSAV